MENHGDQRQEQAPIGTTPMDTAVLKEPRGFIRCIEWLFALVAFATCANFSTYSDYIVYCKGHTDKGDAILVVHDIYYPFKLDSATPRVKFPEVYNTNPGDKCVNESMVNQPGDFQSDAQFFVFTGVIAWLGATACLVIYVFFSQKYLDDDKKAPMLDFCFTVIVAVFWLAASAAWANGVIGLKNAAASENWLFTSQYSVCHQTGETYDNPKVDRCTIGFNGSYGGANASIILGFLNFFLWTANLWFIYKETKWFASRSQPNPPQQMES